MRSEINYKEKKGKKQTTWKLNNMLLNNQWFTEEIKDEINKYLEKNENENSDPKPVGHSSSSERSLQQYNLTSRDKKKSNNLTLQLKQLAKEKIQS